MFFSVFVVVFIFGLHAFDDFFCLYAVTKSFHQIDFDAALFGRCGESVFDPFVRFAAYVNDHVGTCNLCDIVSRGLVTVQIDAILDEQGEVDGISARSENFFCPRIFRINGSDDGNFVIFGDLAFWIVVAGDERKQCCDKNGAHQRIK